MSFLHSSTNFLFILSKLSFKFKANISISNNLYQTKVKFNRKFLKIKWRPIFCFIYYRIHTSTPTIDSSVVSFPWMWGLVAVLWFDRMSSSSWYQGNRSVTYTKYRLKFIKNVVVLLWFQGNRSVTYTKYRLKFIKNVVVLLWFQGICTVTYMKVIIKAVFPWMWGLVAVLWFDRMSSSSWYQGNRSVTYTKYCLKFIKNDVVFVVNW